MIDPVILERLREMVRGRTGQLLDSSRAHGIETRLGAVARREGFASLDALMAALPAQGVDSLGWRVIEALLPGDTEFFRHREQFALLKDQLLPALAKARGRVRLWSAGCATGQEAYSLAVTAAEAHAPGVEILATDISEQAVQKARSGLYTQFEVQRGLSARRVLEWFEKDGEMWRAAPQLRGAVRFERANLLDPPPAGPFDMILCRNVLGDMEPERRLRVLESLSGVLASDGVLITAPSEPILAPGAPFRLVAGRRGVFVKAAPAERQVA